MNFEKLKQEIQKYYPIKGGHTFDHTERVYNLAMTITKKDTNLQKYIQKNSNNCES